MRVIIGGYTAEMGGTATGISSLMIDSGGLEPRLIDELELTSPSYLIAHPQQSLLFVVSEGDPSSVHSVSLANDGALEWLSSRESGGEAACHLALSPDGRYLVVAHYGSGSVASFAVDESGRLSERLSLLSLEGSGPDPERQEASHAHQVVFDAGEVLVPDLGSDRIHRLVLDRDGRLCTGREPIVLPAGSGPRHLARLDDFLVVACELSAELWLGRRDGATWTQAQVIATSAVRGTPAVAPSALRALEDRIQVANRGPGTIAEFALDRVAGRLRPIHEFDGGGPWPRDLVLEDDRIWVANQTTDTVGVFGGQSGEPQAEFRSPSPACIVIVTR